MTPDALMTDYVVLARTEAGSREAVREVANLSSAERRLLLLANGYTSLADLLPRLPDPDTARQSARSLMDAGLIGDADEITRPRGSFPMESDPAA